MEYYIIKILPTYYINTFIPERDYLGTLNLTLRHDDLKAYRIRFKVCICVKD